MERSGNPQSLGFATRDDTFVYYTASDGFHRKPVDGEPNDPGTLIGSGWNVSYPGALLVYQGRVHYAYGNSTPLHDAYSTHVQFAIEYVTAPGAGPTDSPVRVAMGTTIPTDPGVIKKLGVAYRKESGVSSLVPIGVGLTANGYLLGFNMEAPPSFLLEARVLATDVADFVIRREQFTPPGGLQLPFEQDTLYVTTGRAVCAGGTRGAIERVDPLNGNVTPFWTAPDGIRLSAIGADPDFLFVSSFAVGNGGGFGCSIIGTGVIRAKYQPAFIRPPGSPAPSDPNWNQIELIAGDNLRSDGQYLYFTYQQQIRRMPNNSPRIVFDLAAVGVEAVQAVQDFNNSIPLVAGKSVFVRGYAKVVQNSANLTHFPVSAALHVRQNGIEVAGSPLYAENEPLIDEAGELAAVRSDLNRGFQFHLPPSWVAPGT